MANPWDAPELKSEKTKAMEAANAKLRKEGLPKDPPGKKVGEIGATDAWAPATKAENRQKKIALLTKGWGKALNKEK
jgi:hypothetical protein